MLSTAASKAHQVPAPAQDSLSLAMSSGPDSDDTEDYTPTASDMEPDPLSDSESSYNVSGDDEIPASPCKQSGHTLREKSSKRQHRHIISSISCPRDQETLQEKNLEESAQFTFLDDECYSCSCHLSAPPTKRCTVLGYFNLEFIPQWDAIFCPGHNCLIPASKLEHHLCKAHNEWTSPKKTEESKKMAKHVALSFGLNVSQCASDIKKRLPDELDDPLVEKGVYRSSKCPSCASWFAENDKESPPNRSLLKHINKLHQDGKDHSEIGDPQWTYRVHMYPRSSESSHVFVLREGFNSIDLNTHLPFANLPPLPVLPTHTQPSSEIPTIQDWPIRLKWESYAADIKASKHIKQLRTLLGPPRVGNNHFLEKGLRYVKKFCIKYLRGSGALANAGVTDLSRVLVSE